MSAWKDAQTRTFRYEYDGPEEEPRYKANPFPRDDEVSVMKRRESLRLAASLIVVVACMLKTITHLSRCTVMLIAYCYVMLC